MAVLTVPIENGKVVDSDSTTSSKKDGLDGKKTGGLDKEAFLQLLVAQMQYQDPLEPMDNTEYISQLATFSQLEATQNLSDTISQGMANSLVGKYVILNTDYGTVSGKVDYVMHEGGEIYLAVEDGVYSIDTLDTVADSDYYEAFQMANLFSAMIAKLPPVGSATAGDAEAVEKARKVYDSMNSYQQSFISKEDLDKLTALEKRIKELTGASGGDSEGNAEGDSDSEDDSKLEDG